MFMKLHLLRQPTGFFLRSCLLVLALFCFRIEKSFSFTAVPNLKVSYNLPRVSLKNWNSVYLHSLKDNGEEEDSENNPVDTEDDPVDAFIAEREAGRKVAQRLMFPRMVATSISQAITALGWGFLIASFILQTLGYAFVPDNHGGFRIDTLEKLQFQEEIQRSMRDSTRKWSNSRRTANPVFSKL